MIASSAESTIAARYDAAAATARPSGSAALSDVRVCWSVMGSGGYALRGMLIDLV